MATGQDQMLETLIAMGNSFREAPSPIAPGPIEQQPPDLRSELVRQLAELQAQREGVNTQLYQPAPAPVEAAPLSKGDIISRGILKALSTYAAGINPRGGQKTDYLGQLRDRRQQDADKTNVANRQGYEDSRSNALMQLQQILGDQSNVRADIRDETQYERQVGRDEAEASRRADEIKDRQRYDAEQAQLAREAEEDIRTKMFKMESRLKESLAGVRDTSEQNANDGPYLSGIYRGVQTTRKALADGSEKATEEELMQEFIDDLETMTLLSESGKLQAIEYFRSQLAPFFGARVKADEDRNTLARDRKERTQEARLRQDERRSADKLKKHPPVRRFNKE